MVCVKRRGRRGTPYPPSRRRASWRPLTDDEIARGSTCSHSRRRQGLRDECSFLERVVRVRGSSRGSGARGVLVRAPEPRSFYRYSRYPRGSTSPTRLEGGVRRWRRGVEGKSRCRGRARNTTTRGEKSRHGLARPPHASLQRTSRASRGPRSTPRGMCRRHERFRRRRGAPRSLRRARVGAPLGDERTSPRKRRTRAQQPGATRRTRSCRGGPLRYLRLRGWRYVDPRATNDPLVTNDISPLGPSTFPARSPRIDPERFFSPTRRGTGHANIRRQRDARFTPLPLAPEASASYDPLCEFVNPLLDDEHKLDCGGDAEA